jgi:hypothetical protein
MTAALGRGEGVYSGNGVWMLRETGKEKVKKNEVKRIEVDPMLEKQVG